MSLMDLMLNKLFPLYMLIVLGFVAGRWVKINKEGIATLLIYVIAPFVVFHGTFTTPLSAGTFLLPLIVLLIASTSCLVIYSLAKKQERGTRSVVAFAAGAANTGYFGIPVITAILGQGVLGIVVSCTLGIILFENTIGFFMVARGTHSIRQAVKKLLKLPAIYAFILGILLQKTGISFGSGYFDMAQMFKGAYSILGMMLIGIGLSALSDLRPRISTITLAFLGKFVIWPVLALGIVLADTHLFHLLAPQAQKVLVLLSLVPTAANTVAYATILGSDSHKAAIIVFFSTALSALLVPLGALLARSIF
jgi:malate permease and related proteins